MMSSQAITSQAPVARITTARRVGAIAFATIVFTLGLVEPALAQNVEGLLQNVLDLLTGNTARLLAVIAVVLLGIACMFGLFDWRRIAIVVVGIVVVFGAAEIVNLLTGGAA
ncbi:MULTISPECIES: TrbC/VirB2 family protein [unclassified Phenylobacterium]|jgi:type IV secretion system protein VirB2|uniref:TrbC/VirB2 family protein n=1 Tax=unclassified Phenylobacterium TaxID=2640670 RepID=UPI000AF18943|nr:MULTISPECIES: TrbC/VirB2 family protein [unclassified Phenylobacterium]